jgi:glycosyltransferase involved in cell wall biosynthesis
MRDRRLIGVVIPARDEAKAIGHVLAEIPGWVDAIVVADNGSRDATADIARNAGARVVSELRPGYGAACLAGIRALPPVDVVIFLDGDHSDYPDDMATLVDPILEGRAELVIGTRMPGASAALTAQQRFGNGLAVWLIRALWGVRFSDLGPFRAIAKPALDRLGMADRDFGWTVEMQIKAAEQGLATAEVPVRYRQRIGASKISGTVRGTLRAGAKILWVIGRHGLRRLLSGKPQLARGLVKPAGRDCTSD